MKATKYLIIFLVISLIGYFFIINVIFENQGINLIKENYSTQMDYGFEESVGFSDVVQVQLEKNRWYGTIVESLGETTSNSKLYLFNLMELPIEKNGKSYIQAHIIFSCLWLMAFTIILIFHFVSDDNLNKSSK
jgi:hypothetical protein